MNLSKLAYYVGYEKKADQALLKSEVLNRYTHCPFCVEDHFGRIRKTKYKCYVVTKRGEFAEAVSWKV